MDIPRAQRHADAAQNLNAMNPNLKPCPTCGQTIAKGARTCPHCGKTTTTAGGILFAIIVGILLVILLGML